MKKFMFTAIAMVAFMGSSMANTIEIEKLNIVEENIQEESLIRQLPDCAGQRFLIYVELTGNGESHAYASSISYQFYFWCMGAF